MAVSPCTLRSTQCAALIALATAAGIMRVEVAEARASTSRTNSPNERAAVQFDRHCPASAPRFQIAFDAVAPWLALFQVAAQCAAECAPAISVSRPSAVSAAPLPLPPRLRGGPSVRQHAYPFAVGPPARGTLTPTRADDTSVSTDSAARRIAVSRVAVVSLSSFSARLTRLGTPGPTLAGMFPPPSSALRGEPAALRLLSAEPPAFGLPSRRPGPRPAASSLSVS